MKLQRRQFLHLAAIAAGAPALSRSATAQTYPIRPITMIVPLAAGGFLDATARVLAERMRSPLGQPIIIENVTGADGSIATGRVARAKADGYTISLGDSDTHVVNAGFYSLSYDVLNDFAPIAPLITFPIVLFARKSIPAKGLMELVAWLKANPKKASMGVFGSGGRLQSILFQKQTGTEFTLVPYRGGSLAIQDLVAGQIDLAFNSQVQFPLVQAGSIKAYAVATDSRLSRAPDIPTFAESGLPGFLWSYWAGLFVPKGAPPEIINKLNAATIEALAEPAVRSRLVDLGGELLPRERQTPDALGVMQRASAQKWWPLIRELAIRGE
jgi:tripartite-type tricarboxylate transporter receptor subunit TctC